MSLTAATSFAATTDPAVSLVSFRTSQGAEVQATMRRLVPQSVTCEIHEPTLVLRASEVLDEFKIVLRSRPMYSGRAVVRSLVNAGPALVAEVALDENSWTEMQFDSGAICREHLGNEFKDFVNGWQKFYLVEDDYKVVIADIQTFLTDLRLWLDQVELGIQSASGAQRLKHETEIAHELRDPVTSALANMFERFETIADSIEAELQPVHRAFGQRHLHPELLCAPFIHRTYTKPLGYAGDYEMMNMIVRNGLEGNSLYAKLANAYLLNQPGSQAVRNRVGFLCDRIIAETSRVSRLARPANIYCIACGPAWEVVNFLAEHPLADHARFDLLDFNEETLRYTSNKVGEVLRQHHRNTQVQFIKKSVQNLLRSKSKPASNDSGYDLIYCSGLYDYLNDRVIKALNTYLYDQLRPGGLLVVGNFAPNTPVRNFIEHFLEWFLIYRDSKELAELSPEQASPGDCRVIAEPTGANLFLEVRKPR